MATSQKIDSAPPILLALTRLAMGAIRKGCARFFCRYLLTPTAESAILAPMEVSFLTEVPRINGKLTPANHMKRRSFFKTLAAVAIAPMALTKAKTEPKPEKTSLTWMEPPNAVSVSRSPGEQWEIEYPSEIIKDLNGFDAAQIVQSPIIRRIDLVSSVSLMSWNKEYKIEIPPVPGGFPDREFRDLLWSRQPDYCRTADDGQLLLVREWRSYRAVSGAVNVR